ncbi:Autophagy-related protein 17 [Colletotrichum tanaceti]|uniref:Autophagy-related protein 17 n=1 Tax=Colletotrichum tanaceti TaxID=1306861 RepID=A0A4U6X6Y7_9PEZI|nr:Autophagy-related protein 17 [Colletotrichum tanaceti]TKW50874.1 Autophagy-related protein 17 [Colletotrichum tanaceti]
MANSPSHRSPASSTSAGRDSGSLSHSRERRDAPSSTSADPVPVETLVEHLLAAKRSLSSITAVLRANEIATDARQAHEEAVILYAETQFLQRAIAEQSALLMKVRRGLKRTYDAGKRDFKSLVKTMDATNESLRETMDMLKNTTVEAVFRPPGEARRNLMDFVDEKSVHVMREALKQSLGELQSIQTSFDGDLLRFDDDLRALKKSIATSPLRRLPSDSSASDPIPELLGSLVDHSHSMAQLLTSLTKHFDLCVTAVRTTEGGAALARRRAAEVTQSQGGDGVSISGVIADQESHMPDLDPITYEDRADMLEIVVSDASEVESVIQELKERLQAMEDEFAAMTEQTGQIKAAFLGTLGAFAALEDMGGRMASYIASEAEFLQRWEDERYTIYNKLGEMEDLRDFYEKYSNAYDNLILEVERRRMVEDKIASIWKKAKDSVDKLTENDRREREGFRQDVGEFIPTDLWPGMDSGMKRWELVAVDGGSSEDDASGGQRSTPALDRSVVDAARDRLDRSQQRL